MSKITTNSIGFQLLKIRFFGFFGLGARSELKHCLAAAAEIMRPFYVEGSELTEFVDTGNEVPWTQILHLILKTGF
ncbi:MAG: hypothetical protein F6K47_02070 [Symploca sp. SIO2E6]|nr:hypothetical protein [Symploca sp. SIO2E6]